MIILIIFWQYCTMNAMLFVMARSDWELAPNIATFVDAMAKFHPYSHNMQLNMQLISSVTNTYFKTIAKDVVNIICEYVQDFHKHDDNVVDQMRHDYRNFVGKHSATEAIGIKCRLHNNSPTLTYSLLEHCESVENICIKKGNNDKFLVSYRPGFDAKNTGGLLSKKLYPLPCGLMVLQINLIKLCQHTLANYNTLCTNIPAKTLIYYAMSSLSSHDWTLVNRVKLDSISDLIINKHVPVCNYAKLTKCVATFLIDPNTYRMVQIDLHDVLGKEIIDDFGNRIPCDDLTDCEYAFSQYSGACCVYNVCNRTI